MTDDNSVPQCAICFCILKANATYGLPCGHVFHYTCITRWLVSAPTQSCPCCRDAVNHGDVRKIRLDFAVAAPTVQRRRTVAQREPIQSPPQNDIDTSAFPISRVLRVLRLLPDAGSDQPLTLTILGSHAASFALILCGFFGA
ncbi:E3 ubiquitin-protein ligase Praja2, partial [Aphelenchoides avenae]